MVNKISWILVLVGFYSAVFYALFEYQSSMAFESNYIFESNRVLDLSSVEKPQKYNVKLDSRLNQLVSTFNSDSASAFVRQNNIKLLPGNKVRVIITCAPGRMGSVITAIHPKGIVETSYENFLQAVLPINQIKALSNHNDIRQIRLPMKPKHLQGGGDVISQGVELINADAWHSEGYTGSGLKVGVIDGGFVFYETAFPELPDSGSINTWWAPTYGDAGLVDHGTDCAEIIYDIAYDAEFYLANYYTIVEFCNAVDWLISQQVDVISCSVGNELWGPGDGSGMVCDKINDARDAGILWIQAAGNEAKKHWSGTFQDTDTDGWHDFMISPLDESNQIHLGAGQTLTVSLKWNDTWGTSDNDYDLYLVDSGSNDIASSEDRQDGDDDPTEYLEATVSSEGDYHILIGKYSAGRDVFFDLFVNLDGLEYQEAKGSLVVPGDSEDALTVGAVDCSSPLKLAPYSSQGTTIDDRIKPDLAGPTGVRTRNHTDFDGTSASTPHVAGAALLVKQFFGGVPDQTQTFLEDNAVDLGDKCKDNQFGSGRLCLPVDHYCKSFDTQGSWTDDSYIYVDEANSRLYWYTDDNYRAAHDSMSRTTRAGDIIEFEYQYINHSDSNTRQNVIFGFTDSMPTENVFPDNFIGGLFQNYYSDFQTHIMIRKNGTSLFNWGENDHPSGTAATYRARIEIISGSTYSITVWKDNNIVYQEDDRSGDLIGMFFPSCATWNNKTQSYPMAGWYNGQLNYICWHSSSKLPVITPILEMLLLNG